MNQALAFLRHITEMPGDTTPRLVFADWLEEEAGPVEGSPIRPRDLAEFIRVQFAFANLEADDPRLSALRERERNLLHQFRDFWLEPLRGLPAREPIFRNGFVESIFIDPVELNEHASALQAVIPLRELRLAPLPRSLVGQRVRQTFKKVAELSILEQIHSLDLSEIHLVDESPLAVLLESPRWIGLRELTLAPGDGLYRALLRAPLLDRIDTLRITSTRLQPSLNLLESERLGRLRKLELRGRVWLADMQAIATNKKLAGLEALTITRRIDEPCLNALASVSTPRLRRLNLAGVNLDAREFEILACGSLAGQLEDLNLRQTSEKGCLVQFFGRGTFSRLRRLDLTSNLLSTRELAQLARPEILSDLQSLNLRGSRIGDYGLVLLTRASFWPRLRHLFLHYNRLSPVGIFDLANSLPANLETLDLGWNAIGDRAASGLIRALPSSLRALDLSYAEIGDETASALADSGLIRELQVLNLNSNRLTDLGLEALLAGPAPVRLEALDLSNNQLSDTSVMKLLESPVLRHLTVLHLHGNRLSHHLRGELRRHFRGILSWSL